ncbi:carbohydrate ABC transporter permease [Paenibacillus sepulcri]
MNPLRADAMPGVKLQKRPSLQKRKMNRFVWTTLTPILILFLVFSFFPILYGFYLSLSEYDPLAGTADFIGLENFRSIFHDSLFLKSIGTTFMFVAIAVPANIVITLLISLAINSLKNGSLQGLFRSVFFIPVISPIVGSALVWSMMYSYPNGLFNKIAALLGGHEQYWLTGAGTALISVIIMTLWSDIGYNTILFIAGLNTIPDMFYESAKLEGAGSIRIFFTITLPLLSRTTLFVTIMTLFSYFQEFTRFQIMTGGGPENKTRLISLEIYDTAFKYYDMSSASAMAVVLFAIMLVVTIIQLKVGKSRWEY